MVNYVVNYVDGLRSSNPHLKNRESSQILSISDSEIFGVLSYDFKS